MEKFCYKRGTQFYTLRDTFFLKMVLCIYVVFSLLSRVTKLLWFFIVRNGLEEDIARLRRASSRERFSTDAPYQKIYVFFPHFFFFPFCFFSVRKRGSEIEGRALASLERGEIYRHWDDFPGNDTSFSDLFYYSNNMPVGIELWEGRKGP